MLILTLIALFIVGCVKYKKDFTSWVDYRNNVKLKKAKDKTEEEIYLDFEKYDKEISIKLKKLAQNRWYFNNEVKVTLEVIFEKYKKYMKNPDLRFTLVSRIQQVVSIDNMSTDEVVFNNAVRDISKIISPYILNDAEMYFTSPIARFFLKFIDNYTYFDKSSLKNKNIVVKHISIYIATVLKIKDKYWNLKNQKKNEVFSTVKEFAKGEKNFGEFVGDIVDNLTSPSSAKKQDIDLDNLGRVNKVKVEEKSSVRKDSYTVNNTKVNNAKANNIKVNNKKVKTNNSNYKKYSDEEIKASQEKLSKKEVVINVTKDDEEEIAKIENDLSSILKEFEINNDVSNSNYIDMDKIKKKKEENKKKNKPQGTV